MSNCQRCEELMAVISQLEDANAELGRQLAGMELHLRRAGRAEVALRRELADQREEEPEAQAIREVCEHWKKRLNHPRAKTPLTGARAQKVRARLREKFTVEDLKKAIDGCARKPYVGPGGRKAEGSPGDRHDDLELICRDEKHVERFMAIADEPDQPAEVRLPPAPTGPTGVDALLPRLDAVRQVRPGQWDARCPAHEDRHASLSVAQGDKGAVVHCHAGCSADDVARAAGIEIGALFDRDDPPAPRPACKPEAKRTALNGTLLQVPRWQQQLAGHEALLARLRERKAWEPDTLMALGVGWDAESKRLTLPVYDQAGALVNVVRYRPGGKPKTLAMTGCPRDLFPRPEAIDGDEIWLVEGEPDAISARQLGLPAVAVPGTNGWRDAYVQRFVGRRVTICMDCDEHGRGAAERIARSLAGVAQQVRVADLDPSRDDGWDLGDLLVEGGTAEVALDLAALSGVVVRMPGEAA